MKTISTTATMLAEAIEKSELTQREIADRVGFKNANIISMLKTGETRVPLDRIPALSQTLGMDERLFLMIAIEEYHPGVHEVLVDVLGLPLPSSKKPSLPNACENSSQRSCSSSFMFSIFSIWLPPFLGWEEYCLNL